MTKFALNIYAWREIKFLSLQLHSISDAFSSLVGSFPEQRLVFDPSLAYNLMAE